MASTAVYRTLSQNYGTGGGITTISFWFKRARTGTNEVLTSSYYSGSYYGQFQLGSNDKLTIQDWRSSNVYSKTTNMVFRDTSAFYHVCWSFNNRTGGSSSSNLWINGELITSWASETEYSYQATTSWNTDYTHYIGCLNTSSSQAYFSGVIADYYFIQGQEYQASLFGETDSVTGEWKPLTNPTIDYSGTGGNSCHLKFENSANMDLDSGDNNLTFTTSGTLTKTEDCPSNVFATLNPLLPSNPSLTNGNLSLLSGSASWLGTASTLGFSSGKFYYEVKITDVVNYTQLGVVDESDVNGLASTYVGIKAKGWGYNAGTGEYYNNGTGTSYGASYGNNDVIGIAIDADNNKLYFSKNGVWQNSSDPTSGATGTGAISISHATGYDTWFPAVSCNYIRANCNFGNGFFGTTEITTNTGTGYQDADGNGRFYYAVPTNYRCLSTKGLNQ